MFNLWLSLTQPAKLTCKMIIDPIHKITFIQSIIQCETFNTPQILFGLMHDIKVDGK